MQKEELEKLNILDKEIEKTENFIDNMENYHVRISNSRSYKHTGKADVSISLRVGVGNQGSWHTFSENQIIDFLSYKDKEDIESRILALRDQFHRYILSLAEDKLSRMKREFEFFTGNSGEEETE